MQKINVARVCAATFVAFTLCLTANAEDGYIESDGDAYVSLGHCAGPSSSGSAIAECVSHKGQEKTGECYLSSQNIPT